MLKLSYTLIFAVLASIFTSCDPCAQTGRPCADVFSFRLVDKITEKDLVFSTVPTYQKDSVDLTSKRPGYLGSLSRTDGNKFTSTILLPIYLFLRISSAEIDTLVLAYDFVKTKCCKSNEGFRKLQSIRFNGVVANRVGEIYVSKNKLDYNVLLKF